jgi:hypothetical protein
MRERNDRSFEDYESMFGTAMGSIAFKVKKSFLEKALILNFCQKCVLSIFRVKKNQSTFGNFYQTCHLFVWHNFLDIKKYFLPFLM